MRPRLLVVTAPRLGLINAHAYAQGHRLCSDSNGRSSGCSSGFYRGSEAQPRAAAVDEWNWPPRPNFATGPKGVAPRQAHAHWFPVITALAVACGRRYTAVWLRRDWLNGSGMNPVHCGGLPDNGSLGAELACFVLGDLSASTVTTELKFSHEVVDGSDGGYSRSRGKSNIGLKNQQPSSTSLSERFSAPAPRRVFDTELRSSVRNDHIDPKVTLLGSGARHLIICV